MLEEATVSAIDVKAEAWANAVNQAIAEREEVFAERDEMFDWFYDEWSAWKPEIDLPPEAARVVTSYLKRGLSEAEITDAIEIAMLSKAPRASKFRYFCGVCRNKLEAIHKRALEIIREEDER